jgi:SAM-dependent MidA family methyltransferase
VTGESVAWSTAWRAAHLGREGFYRHHTPERHFATEAQGGPIAEAVAVFIDRVVRQLAPTQSGTVVDIIDVGAGSGELSQSLVDLLGQDPRYRFTAIDVRPRPESVSRAVHWIVGEAPGVLAQTHPEGITGVILAHEWLDDVPVDVVTRDEAGVLRHVLVEPKTGRETLGEPVLPDSDAQRWLDQWWGPVVDRAELGMHRDAAWRDLCASLQAGAAVAIDYGHLRAERERFAAGSVIGYRDGATHWPIPDGSMNITAHVTWESVAAATVPPGVVLGQSEMLAELLPPIPPLDRVVADIDPRRYADHLQRHTQRARLMDRSAAVSWLTVTIDQPPPC